MFNNLVHDVESFPSRVSSYLAKAESEEASGFWAQLWLGLKHICAAFWRALQKIFEDIVATFRSMFDRIARIQCSFGKYLGLKETYVVQSNHISRILRHG
jgi:hypothetical protein